MRRQHKSPARDLVGRGIFRAQLLSCLSLPWRPGQNSERKTSMTAADPGLLQSLAQADTEIEAKVRLMLDARLRHCIKLNKLPKLRAALHAGEPTGVNLQACLVMAVSERRPAIVSYLMRELRVRLPFYHSDYENCGCSICSAMAADPRCLQVYALEIFPCAVSPLYVFCLEASEAAPDPVAYCLRMAARLSQARSGLLQRNLVKAYKLSKRAICACLGLLLDQTETRQQARQLLLHCVEPDLAACASQFSPYLGRTLLLAEFRLTKPLVHRATQTILEAEFSRGSELLGDMWSVLGFAKMLLVSAVAFFVLTPVSILFPHPSLVRFLKSARVLAVMEVVSIGTYMMLVLAGANTSSNDIQSIVCFNSDDNYLRLQMFALAFIVARLVDEAYNLGLMSAGQFYVSMFDYLLTVSLAMHFSSLLFLSIWSSDVEFFGVSMPRISQSLCNISLNSSLPGPDLCTVLQALSDSGASQDLDTLRTLMEPVFYINTITGLGNLFLFISLGNVFVWQKTMGVLAITVQSMMKDVAKFLSVLITVHIAYTTAMTNLYRNFQCGVSVFGSTFTSIAVTFFWAMFGMTTPQDYTLTGTTATWDQFFSPMLAVQFTTFMGQILYASWMILGFVVCVNLLIAMMSVSFQRIQSDKDNSWLRARTRRMIRFTLVHHHQLLPLPVPYNLASPIVFAAHHLLSRLLPTAAADVHGEVDDDGNCGSERERQEQRQQLLEELRDRVAVDLRLETSAVTAATSAAAATAARTSQQAAAAAEAEELACCDDDVFSLTADWLRAE